VVALLVLNVAVLTWGVTAAVSAATSAPDPGSEAAFVAHINNARAAQGMAGLQVSADLVADARQHAEAMAADQRVFDDPGYESQVQGWQAVGENSGMGPSVDSVDQAFMASPPHRANILGGYSQVGVGVVWTGSTLWVAEVFRLPSSQPAASAPPPTSPPTTAAPPPPTTAAPPSSTTAAPRSSPPATAAAPTRTTAPPSPAPTAAPATSPPAVTGSGGSTAGSGGLTAAAGGRPAAAGAVRSAALSEQAAGPAPVPTTAAPDSGQPATPPVNGESALSPPAAQQQAFPFVTAGHDAPASRPSTLLCVAAALLILLDVAATGRLWRHLAGADRIPAHRRRR
jgi:hypothetical protein